MKLTTQTIQVFDPAMCCSTGVCGPEVDTKLVQFAADLDWLKAQDVIVQRHNLSQNPAAFVENPTAQRTLMEKGEAALPVILVNGKVAATGRYPDRAELAGWFKLKVTVSGAAVKSDCCGGGETC
ncbi:MAG: arsenite efflux transporter metallochaperone ArsD [Verrucomicrobiota bacterium]